MSSRKEELQKEIEIAGFAHAMIEALQEHTKNNHDRIRIMSKFVAMMSMHLASTLKPEKAEGLDLEGRFKEVHRMLGETSGKELDGMIKKMDSLGLKDIMNTVMDIKDGQK